MAKGLCILSITLLALFTQNANAAEFYVTKYGGMGQNKNVTLGFLSAWKDMCASPTPSVMIIPPGTYLISPVKVYGHACKERMEIKVLGTLKASKNPVNMNGADGWISFSNIDRLTINGGGVFDGNGEMSWHRNQCKKKLDCQLPINLRFNAVTNSYVMQIVSKNSKNFHINVNECRNMVFDNIIIETPGDSPNTDGIHVGRSTDIKILNSGIHAGDDCISVGEGTDGLTVEKVTCGPGHGFSIGSLGRQMGESNVRRVHFNNCTLKGTSNGVRIKTWPSSPPGYSLLVSEILFENIILNDVLSPVLIDQSYCPNNLCNKEQASLVQISDVSIKNLRGTSPSQVAIQLSCSKAKPCQKIQIGDVDIQFNGNLNGNNYNVLSNVQPILTGKQNPPIHM